MARRIEYQVALSELRAIRERNERRCLIIEDHVFIGHILTNTIGREEASMARLAMKAEEERLAKIEADLAAAAANHDGQTVDAKGTPVDNKNTESNDSDDIPEPEPKPTNGPAPQPNGGAGGKNGIVSGGKKGNAIGDGHGKTGAAAYTRAIKIFHKLAGVIGQLCTKCGEATMTRYRAQVHIRIVGQPFFGSECHHAEQAHCKACGRVVSALPAHVTEGFGKAVTWDASAAAMLILLHYFYGTPFKRIETLHKAWGTPLADATQWEIASEAVTNLTAFFNALIVWAIQNMTNFSMDDTGTIILTLKRQIATELAAAAAMGLPEGSVRTGINASGFYIVTPKGTIVLYFTGRHHAAEILRKLLQHRLPGSPTVTKITDGASKNFVGPEIANVEEGVCNTHALLKWYDHKDEFPAYYKVVGEAYHAIYTNEATTVMKKMTPEERLTFHQKNSRPWMEKIRALCHDIAIDRRAEPKTALYEAVHFFLNQWPRLTKFLEVKGMPLDTNLCEQTLIAVVRYLAASFNYHTERGAEVGDAGMSLIATCRANEVEPWTWLTDCLKHPSEIAKNPEDWFPWNWKERMANQAALPEPSDALQKAVV